MWAQETIRLLLSEYDFGTVLDIGAGAGEHSEIFRKAGKRVLALDWSAGERYEDTEIAEPVDCIWCSHVLEHLHNPGIALEKMRRDVKPGGVVAITVPPLKHEIVGGHVSLWNAGLLLYRLILAGFDCSAARVRSHDYNVSVITRRVDADLPPLKHDAGDLEALARFFPMPVWQGFEGRIERLNW